MKKLIVLLTMALSASAFAASTETTAQLCSDLGKYAYDVQSMRKLMTGLNWSPLSVIESRRAHFKTKIADGSMTQEQVDIELKKDTFVAIELAQLPSVITPALASDIVIQKCLMKLTN